LLAAALGAAAIPAVAQQSMPGPASQGMDRPQDFACSAGHPLDFTREELEQKAVEELHRKGGRMPAQYKVQLKRWGCDWWVFVLHDPPGPQSAFGVLVDGISGEPKQFVLNR